MILRIPDELLAQCAEPDLVQLGTRQFGLVGSPVKFVMACAAAVNRDHVERLNSPAVEPFPNVAENRGIPISVTDIGNSELTGFALGELSQIHAGSRDAAHNTTWVESLKMPPMTPEEIASHQNFLALMVIGGFLALVLLIAWLKRNGK